MTRKAQKATSAGTDAEASTARKTVAIVAPKGLTTQQQDDFEALTATRTVREAATLLGCHASTLYRRLQDHALSDALRDARHQMLRRGIHSLHAAVEEAAICLRTIIADPRAKTGHRVAACRVALSYGFDGLTVDRLESQVELLEQQAKTINENDW